MNWNEIKSIRARALAQKQATEDKILRTNELLEKYINAGKEQPAQKVGSDPCLRSLRRHLYAAKHASDGLNSFQRVGKLLKDFVARDPLCRMEKIAAERDLRMEKARTITEETRKGQPDKPATAPLEGQPHDGEGREVTFSDGRKVTFKSAADREAYLAKAVTDAYNKAYKTAGV